MDYLISRGHREIACITVPIHTPTGKARLMGYRKALEKHGIRLNERRIKYGDAGMTRGYELCKELIAEKTSFSALFACNDDMASAPPKHYTAGLKIPQDISLFGFDDAPSAKWLEPALSSVYLPIDNMIVTAIDQRSGWQNQPVEAIPPFTGTLVLRDSVTTGPWFNQTSSNASSS